MPQTVIAFIQLGTWEGVAHKKSRRVLHVREIDTRPPMVWHDCYRTTASAVLPPSVEWLNSRLSSHADSAI